MSQQSNHFPDTLPAQQEEQEGERQQQEEAFPVRRPPQRFPDFIPDYDQEYVEYVLAFELGHWRHCYAQFLQVKCNPKSWERLHKSWLRVSRAFDALKEAYGKLRGPAALTVWDGGKIADEAKCLPATPPM